MIHVPLTFIVFLYLFVGVGVLLIAWLAHERRRRGRAHEALHYRLRCAICGLEFEDRSGASPARCPRCGQPNERLPLDPI